MQRIAVCDKVSARAQRLAALHNNSSCQVLAVAQTEITQCDVVVLACGAAHAGLAAQFIRSGVHVVSLSDDVSDCMNLLALNDQASEMNVVVLVGAASSPGVTWLLLRSVAKSFDVVD